MICNTAVTSLTTNNIVTITINIINNNINGLTVFPTGSIAIIIINQTIINITNIAALKNPSTFALSPAANGYKSIRRDGTCRDKHGELCDSLKNQIP